jgi:Tol biopolymer transport system component
MLAGCGGDSVIAPPNCGGSRIVVFASNGPGQFDVFLFNFDTGGFRPLSTMNSATAADSNPCITNDGRVVAFESDRTGNQDILLFESCVGSFVAQPGLVTSFDETDPAFTWDGLKLAFVRDTLTYQRIRMLDGVADRLVPLPGLDTTGTFDDWAPAPNSTGEVIAFISNRNGNPDLFVYDAAGDTIRALPDLVSPGEEADPWLSSDGRYLAFASDRTGGQGDFDVYLYDLQNKIFIAVGTGVNTADRERNPVFSQNRQRMTFASNRSLAQGGQDLYNFTTGAGAPVLSLASTPGFDAAPFLLYP